jgi:hypothetical protein
LANWAWQPLLHDEFAKKYFSRYFPAGSGRQAVLIPQGMPAGFLRNQPIALLFALIGIFILAATVACSSGDDAVAPATSNLR